MTWRELIWRLLKAYPLRPYFKWRHRCCLRRIAALERENYPKPFTLRSTKFGPLVEWSMRPGAVWPVSDPTDIQFYRTPNLHQIISSPWAVSGAAAKHKADVERVLFAHQPTERSTT